MKDLTITAIIKVYQYDELNEADRSLMKTAMGATARSYAPYLHFSVGAAALLNSGTIMMRTSQENVAYPLGLCTERTTLFYTNSQYPDQPVNTLVIAARAEKDFIETPIPPCGACRQVVLETEKCYGQLIRVLLYGRECIYEVKSIGDLLPLSFDASAMEEWIMLQQYHTKLKETLALTDSYLIGKALQKEKGLYKFIWVRQGSITVEIDHREMVLSKNDVISLTYLQHLEFKSIDGEYMTLLSNNDLYCIYGNDREVSCSGFLFNSPSHLARFTLNEAERRQLDQITEAMENEFIIPDSLQEEMLRTLLKRSVIQCTRIARQRLDITREKESGFEIVRRYYNLVDEHYRTEKQVQDHTDMLHKSPKTLSNTFSICKLPSPLRVIHERVEAEAKRLLLYSNKSTKETADILGSEDQASLNRFFRNMTGQSAVQPRNTEVGKN